jgi:hypothetical protein
MQPARWMLNGDRPEISETYPLPLQLLMKACWAEEQGKRIEFQLIVPVLEALCAAHDEGILVDSVPEPNHAPQEKSWDKWLAALGLADMQDSLGDYLSAGKELLELKQMDEDDLNEDILEDDDLSFDADAKDRFRAAVDELKSGSTTVKEADPLDALMEWVAANQQSEPALAKSPWRKVLLTVRAVGRGGTRVNDGAAMNGLVNQLQAKDAALQAKDVALQAQGTELMEVKRQLDNALANTRDDRSSGTPPKARRSSTPPPRKRP